MKNISIDDKLPVLIEKLKSAKLQTGKAEIEGSYSDLCKMLNSKGPRRGPPLFKDSRDLAQWRKRNFELLEAFNVTFEELPYRNQDFRLYKFSLIEICEDEEIPDL
jgi:hypothetical protein